MTGISRANTLLLSHTHFLDCNEDTFREHSPIMNSCPPTSCFEAYSQPLCGRHTDYESRILDTPHASRRLIESDSLVACLYIILTHIFHLIVMGPRSSLLVSRLDSGGDHTNSIIVSEPTGPRVSCMNDIEPAQPVHHQNLTPKGEVLKRSKTMLERVVCPTNSSRRRGNPIRRVEAISRLYSTLGREQVR